LTVCRDGSQQSVPQRHELIDPILDEARLPIARAMAIEVSIPFIPQAAAAFLPGELPDFVSQPLG